MDFVKKHWQRLKWALTPRAEKNAQLEAALCLLRDIPETKSLLEMADKKSVPIRFDAGLIGGKTRGIFTRSSKPGHTRITLRPFESAGVTAATLTHELRHMWQADVLGLGSRDLRGEYADPASKIITTRVKEADAFAFTHYIIKRVERMNADLAELGGMVKQMTGDVPGLSLTRAQMAQINAHFHAKNKNMQQEDLDLIRGRFLDELKDLDGYDRRSLRKYHALYTHPDFTPHEKPANVQPVDIAQLRRILRAGVNDFSPDYMAGVTDADLVKTVLAPVAPDVQAAARRIYAFEKAAAKTTLDKKTAQAAKDEIDAEVRSVCAAIRKKKLPKTPFGG